MEEQDDPLTPTRMEVYQGKAGTWAPVRLLPENEDAAEIYMLTRAQVVTSIQGQPIDISIAAVKIAMDLCGVVDQRECLRQVRTLWHHMESKRQGQEQ